MNIDLARGRELLLELAAAVTRGRGDQNATLSLSQDSTWKAIGLQDSTDADVMLMVQNMREQVGTLPMPAFPVMISATPTGTDIYLGGVRVHEVEIEDVLEDFTIVEEAMLDVPRSEDTAYSIGLAGRLRPNGVNTPVVATSPLEAVMKFTMTKVALNDMSEITADNPDVKAGFLEMRSRHDWAQHDISSLFEQACDQINNVLRNRDPEMAHP